MIEGEDGHFYWTSLPGTASIAYQLRIGPSGTCHRAADLMPFDPLCRVAETEG